MNALAGLLVYAGLSSLALSMPRHHRTVFAREIPGCRRTTLRVAGWLLLLLSGATTFRVYGAEIGPVAWFATAAPAGFGLTVLLAYFPRLWPLPLAALLLAAWGG